MQKKTEVYDIIHSLSSNEKRAFRLFAKQSSGEKNYVKLYTALAAMPEYSDELFAKKTKGFAFNIAYEKHYLLSQLLRFLRNYHNQFSASSEVAEILKSAEIIKAKDLHSVHHAQLLRGIKLAEQYELWQYHIGLIDQQNLLNRAITHFDQLVDDVKKNHAVKQKLLRLLFTYNEVFLHNTYIFQAVHARGSRLDTKSRSAIRENIHALEKILRYPESRSSFRIQALIVKTIALGYLYLEKTESSYAYEIRVLELFEKHPQFKTEDFLSYSRTTMALMEKSLMLGKYEDCQRYSGQFKTLLAGASGFYKTIAERESASYSFYFETSLRLKLKQYPELLASAKQFDAFLSKRPDLLKYKPVFNNYLQLGRAYFVNRKFKDALRCFFNLVHAKPGWMAVSYLTGSFIFISAIHFEKGNTDQVSLFCKKAIRFMADHKVEDAFADKFLNLLLKANALFAAERRNLVRKEMNKLRSLVNESNDEYEALLEWLETQI